MKLRRLTCGEIEYLTANGCISESWDMVEVDTAIDLKYIKNVTFSGYVKLGKFESSHTCSGGMVKHSGLNNVCLHNCTLQDNVYIRNISNCIANYTIESNVYIENCESIVTAGKSAFGNGTLVHVMNEAGGRDIIITEQLNAHTAYIMAMFRHRKSIISNLENLASEYTELHSSEIGVIGENAVIVNAGSISNMMIGAYSKIDGASKLLNGTILSDEINSSYIGRNVIAEDFIASKGVSITNSVIVSHCFIGESCVLSNLFSAHHSLFFANCNFENGEAAAVFAGPYTVSLHKSSLLIAGMYSFLNAGSGSNQSNHMYKLGPIHHGIVERGSKTTSDSYILWPASIGAFSLVMGRHVEHPDTSTFPFSYLIESKGVSYLVPGVSLKSVGTIRDTRKWVKRDRRKGNIHADYINFNLLSPYTVERMVQALGIMKHLQSVSGDTCNEYMYNGMRISRSALQKGMYYYNLAIDKFMGNSIISRIANCKFTDINELRNAMKSTSLYGEGVWNDMAGLLIPLPMLEHLLYRIENGDKSEISRLNNSFRDIDATYYDMEWTWVAAYLPQWCGKRYDELEAEDLKNCINRWIYAVETIDNLLYADAKKEYSAEARVSFRSTVYSGDDDAEFATIRGDFDSDEFVTMVLKHKESKNTLAQEMLNKIESVMR